MDIAISIKLLFRYITLEIILHVVIKRNVTWERQKILNGIFKLLEQINNATGKNEERLKTHKSTQNKFWNKSNYKISAMNMKFERKSKTILNNEYDDLKMNREKNQRLLGAWIDYLVNIWNIKMISNHDSNISHTEEVSL